MDIQRFSLTVACQPGGATVQEEGIVAAWQVRGAA